MDDAGVAKYLSTRQVHAGASLAILVDAFCFVQAQSRVLAQQQRLHAAGGTPRSFYLLSHFHSDHYNGITSTWRHGAIHCSEGTAALVRGRLGVADNLVVPLRYNTCYHFSLRDGVLLHAHDEALTCPMREACLAVTSDVCPGNDHDASFALVLLPANHCPGAAMFLLCSRVFGVVLHTGDFRYNRSLSYWQSQRLFARRWHAARALALSGVSDDAPVFYEPFLHDLPLLQRVAGRVDTLFLDNTFCDTPFRFPTQLHVTQEIIAAVRANLLQAARDAHARRVRGHASHRADDDACVRVSCAVVIGSYSIGKERVALEVQDAFCAADASLACVPVYVHPYKYRMLQQLDYHVARFASLRADGAAAAAAGDDGDGDAPPATTSRAGRGGKKRLRAVSAPAHEVLLPWCDVNAADTTTARSSGANDVDARYCLSIFLVPLWSVDAASLSIATRGLRGPREDDDDDDDEARKRTQAASAARQLLFLGGDLGLDLSSYDRVLAVTPTGWMRRTSSHAVGSRVTLLRVPYSEHCSFDEMLDFVAFVNPRRVVPTVSPRQYAKHEAVFLERAPRLRAQQRGSQPITRFFAATSSTSSVACVTATQASAAVDPLLAHTSGACVHASATAISVHGKRRRPVGATRTLAATDASAPPSLRQATLFDAAFAAIRQMSAAPTTASCVRTQSATVVVDVSSDEEHADSDGTCVLADDEDSA